jgi:NAD(P)-dependent dehydrogenase (short-subunit alcohol dehydrogenase family)
MENRLKRKIGRLASGLFREKGSHAEALARECTLEPDQASDGEFAPKLLTGKNVLITGAGGIIGRALAFEMAKQGANIYFTDIEQTKIDSLGELLTRQGVEFKGFDCDIADVAKVESLCKGLVNSGTRIDVLVNNVGIQFQTTTLAESSIAEWRRTYEVNVIGPALLTRLITNSMIKNGIDGSVIFITSIHQFAISGWAAYSSSKAALGMLIRELAVSLASHRIRVNGIAPGWVASDGMGQPLKHKYTLLHKTSVPAAYIGRAAVYLAADYYSKYTTGSVMKIDAGLSLHNHRVQQIYPSS